jgi:hypothetical protein
MGHVVYLGILGLQLRTIAIFGIFHFCEKFRCWVVWWLVVGGESSQWIASYSIKLEFFTGLGEQ